MASYDPVKLAFNTVVPENCAEDKPPIIFLHGLSEAKEHWRDIPRTVANETKQKVYALDARNHGDSDWSDTFDFDCNVVDLLHFMDSNNIPRATIVGHSMGGIAAMKTALQAPERVVRVVIEDISVTKSPPEVMDLGSLFLSLFKTAMQQQPPNLDEEEGAKFMVDFIYNGLPPEIGKLVPKPSVDDFRFLLKRTEDERYVFKANIDVILRAIKNPDTLMTEHTGVFEGPAHFIYGTLSPFQVGSIELQTRKFFPNAEFAAVENSSHMVHTDFPKEFTKLLLKCLQKE